MSTRLQIRSLPCGRITPGSASRRPYSVDLDVAAGESVAIVGGWGTGKTDAALALSGFSEDPPLGMRVLLEGKDIYAFSPLLRAQRIGLVPCQTNLVFSCLAASVRREMELCFSFLGRSPDDRLIEETSALLGLGHLMARDPVSLSGGEKVRLAIGLGLLKTPDVLIFDDALRELDPGSERVLRDALDTLRKERGLVTVEFQTRPRECGSALSKTWLFITPQGPVQGPLDACWRKVAALDPGLLPPFAALAGRLESVLHVDYPEPPTAPEAVAALLRRNGFLSRAAGSPETLGSDEPRLKVSRLAFRYSDDAGFMLGPLSHAFKSGTVTSLLGVNGAGKTTALRCLGNLIDGWDGEIEVYPGFSARLRRLPEWAKAAQYCFQNADDQIFRGSVYEEMSVAARHTRGASYNVASHVAQVADDLGLGRLLRASPTELPRPLRRMVTLGAAFVAAPPVILLDEPTVDLDKELIDRVERAILRYCGEDGTVVLVSHDYDFVGNVSDAVVSLEGGVFSRAASKRAGDSWPMSPEPCVTQVARLLGGGAEWSEGDFLSRLNKG